MKQRFLRMKRQASDRYHLQLSYTQPGDNMTPQEYYNQMDIILDIIKRCTTWDQLQVLAKQHGHITQIRYAINERACEISG